MKKSSYREEPRRMDCHQAQFLKTQTSTLHKYEANLPPPTRKSGGYSQLAQNAS